MNRDLNQFVLAARIGLQMDYALDVPEKINFSAFLTHCVIACGHYPTLH